MRSDHVVAGKYRLISLLGQGGMGSVWRAEHLGLKAPVAIKLLAPALDARPDSLTRFFREAQSAANLRSPHVVQILEHGVDEETRSPFIVMELMEGESLADRLDRVSRLSGKDTSRVITHAARALNRAHELGIVHRDLKPGNLFVVQNDDEEIVKVLDFGVAKWRPDGGADGTGTVTATGQMMGTIYYMSPEQIEDVRQVDHRTDLWALGVIAFECLTGKRPYDGENLVAIAIKICSAPIPNLPDSPALPSGLKAWFARALAKDPAARFQSARELAEELRQACGQADRTSASSTEPVIAEVGTAPSRVSSSAVASSGSPASRSASPASRSASPTSTSNLTGSGMSSERSRSEVPPNAISPATESSSFQGGSAPDAAPPSPVSSAGQSFDPFARSMSMQEVPQGRSRRSLVVLGAGAALLAVTGVAIIATFRGVGTSSEANRAASNAPAEQRIGSTATARPTQPAGVASSPPVTVDINSPPARPDALSTAGETPEPTRELTDRAIASARAKEEVAVPAPAVSAKTTVVTRAARATNSAKLTVGAGTVRPSPGASVSTPGSSVDVYRSRK